MDPYLIDLERWRNAQSGKESQKVFLAEQLGLPSVTNYTNWLRRGSLPKAYIDRAKKFLSEQEAGLSSSSDTDFGFISKFRHAAPYIQAHRDRVIVIAMPGEVFSSPGFENLIHDLALLACLGIKLVIVHGARVQIEAKIENAGLTSQIVDQTRVTTDEELPYVVEAINELTTRLVSAFSTGMPNTPRFGVQLSVLSGNFVIARPMGVRNGVDYEHTGIVRQIQGSRISSCLDAGNIVVVPTLGYSLTGELFNLSIQDLVSEIAAGIGADKLICLTASNVIGQLDLGLGAVIDAGALNQKVLNLDEPGAMLKSITPKVLAAGCRCHLIDFGSDGAILQELFTPEGQGIMVVDEDYQKLRPATIEDIGGIIDLIRPLEDRGILVKRSRDLLERYIDSYYVIECDQMIVACGAIIPYSGKTAELACIATHPSFTKQGLGRRLVDALIRMAKKQGFKKVFILTTEGEHWFIERGFREASLDALPEEKRQAYNYQRGSKVLIRNI